MTALLRAVLCTAVALAAALLGVGVAGSAAATPRCASECPTLSVSSATSAAGTALTVIGTDFGELDLVTLRFSGATNPLRSVKTNAAGAFRATLTLPSDVAGRRPIVASDPTTNERARRVVTIGAPAGAELDGARVGSKAYAGVAVIGFGALCVVLLIGGGSLLVVRRRQHFSI